MHVYNIKLKIRRLRSGAIALMFLGAYGVAALAPFVPAQTAFAGTTDHSNIQNQDVSPQTSDVHKSYVCKYVGTPGVNERLQTGQNPIWVDNHSLLGTDGITYVGESFSDAQGKSVVIVANTVKLDPEPGIDQCPAPQGPVKDATASFTLVPATCTADGSVTFAETFATLTSGGQTTPGAHTVTFTATTGHVFADGSNTLSLSYTVAAKLPAGSETCTVPTGTVKVTLTCAAPDKPGTASFAWTATGDVAGSITVEPQTSLNSVGDPAGLFGTTLTGLTVGSVVTADLLVDNGGSGFTSVASDSATVVACPVVTPTPTPTTPVVTPKTPVLLTTD